MEPQINADERRFVDRNFQQNSTRMTRIKRIFTDPCESASSAQYVFYRTGGKVSELICVPRRFFCNANFQYCSTLSQEPAGFQHDERRLVKLNLWDVEET
jgi:hypothetical protein